MIPQQIIFDLDDTLIHCNKYFEKTMHQFANLISHWFIPHTVLYDDVRAVQHQYDLKAVKESGFQRDHFPQSFIKTYHHFSKKCNRTPVRQEILHLWELGDSVYHQDFEAYPNMLDTLIELKDAGHTLHLYTGGEHEIQYRKIEKMGLQTFFDDRIYVARRKVTDFLESVLTAYHFDREHTWMIGNSLRTDILPAFETGIHAIFIPAEVEWEYNLVEIDIEPPRTFFKLSELKEVLPTIRAHVSGEQTPKSQ
jgi:putative hydrolase of the HAD superfamily